MPSEVEKLAEEVVRLVLLAGAISVFGIVITKSIMLERVRMACDRKYPGSLGYAIKCTFCTMGWTSLGLTLAYQPQLLERLFGQSAPLAGLHLLSILNSAVSWIALWSLATLWYRHTWPFLQKNAPKMRVNWLKPH